MSKTTLNLSQDFEKTLCQFCKPYLEHYIDFRRSDPLIDNWDEILEDMLYYVDIVIEDKKNRYIHYALSATKRDGTKKEIEEHKRFIKGKKLFYKYIESLNFD